MTSAAPRPRLGLLRQAFFWVAWLVARLLFLLYFRVRVHGRPQPVPRGPLVVAANHCSFLDPVLLGVALGRPIAFMVTADQYYRPLLRPLMWAFGAIPVQGGRRNVQAVREALAELRAGHVVGIFPEGGISRDGRLQEGHTGVATLILQGDAPVLTASLAGTQRAMAREMIFPRPHRLTVEFGELLQPAELAAGLMRPEARVVIRDRVMTEIARRLPEDQRPLPEATVESTSVTS